MKVFIARVGTSVVRGENIFTNLLSWLVWSEKQRHSWFERSIYRDMIGSTVSWHNVIKEEKEKIHFRPSSISHISLFVWIQNIQNLKTPVTFSTKYRAILSIQIDTSSLSFAKLHYSENTVCGAFAVQAPRGKWNSFTQMSDWGVFWWNCYLEKISLRLLHGFWNSGKNFGPLLYT